MATSSTEITNPKENIERRLDEAENGKKGRDAGDLAGPAKDMFKPSSTPVPGYPRKRPTPPADMIKKHYEK